MDSDSHSGGSRQLRAQFINCLALAQPPNTLSVGFARGGRLTRTGVGVFTVDPDPQPQQIGTNIAFGQGTCDFNRTVVEVWFRPAAPPLAVTDIVSFFYAWNAAGTQLTLTTTLNAVAADGLAFDLVIFEAERSGATGAS